MASKKYQLTEADWKRVIQNAVIFLGPVAVVALGLFINGESDPKVYAVAVAVWFQGVIIDTLRKWNSSK